MADVLRVFKQFPAARDSLARVHLVETSRPLRQQQEKSLSSASVEVAWHESIEEVPVEEDDMYTMFIAHEFFDALPIHVFEVK
jgi:NADH dehydrogenase [ubiquinone] 1 alpha subcomplex assembly factor 7